MQLDTAMRNDIESSINIKTTFFSLLTVLGLIASDEENDAMEIPIAVSIFLVFISEDLHTCPTCTVLILTQSRKTGNVAS